MTATATDCSCLADDTLSWPKQVADLLIKKILHVHREEGAQFLKWSIFNQRSLVALRIMRLTDDPAYVC